MEYLDKKNILTGLEWIDQDPLFLAVITNLSLDKPQGENLENDDLFDDLSTEMIKRGTLNHNSIHWDLVCEQSAELLEKRTKDFRLLLYILYSLPNIAKYEYPLTLGCALTSRFIILWSKSAYPIEKKRISIIRKIADAINALFDNAIRHDMVHETAQFSAQSLREIADFFSNADSELGASILSLSNKIEAAVIPDDEDGSHSLEKIIKEPFKPKPMLEVHDKGKMIPSMELHSENLVLDTKNERALKQSLTVVADFILNMDTENPLSYQLRRFATWYGVKEPPEQRKKDVPKTVILPVSVNALEEYKIAVERGQTDYNIVQKLEKSCQNQPFWMEGQYLAYKLAVICNRKEAARAIYESTYKFVSSTDWIKKLQFSDGSCFLPNEVKEWLDNYHNSFSLNATKMQIQETEMIGNDIQTTVRSAREKANQGKLNEAIKILEEAKPTYDSPRSRTLWEMLMLECLSEWGMQNLVSTQAERLEKNIKKISVEYYEPEILKRIQRLIKE